MTIEELTQLARHIPAGTRITLSFEIERPPGNGGPVDSENRDAVSSGAELPTGEILDPAGGPTRLKVRDAAAAYEPSAREFKEAVAGGFIPFTTKRNGKDAGAHQLSIPDIELYNERRQAIMEFREDPPEGWPGPGGRR